MIDTHIKVIKTNSYFLSFDMNSGISFLTGINGHKDPFVLNYPSLLDIGIMGHCLNKCSICYQGDNHQSHMTFDNFKIIIDQSKSAMQVALGGRGDPNLHPDFLKIVTYARENVIIPNYTTSGNGLTDEQAEISRMCGAVAISDYNQSFTYDAFKKFTDIKIKTNIHFIFSSERFDRAIHLLEGKDVFNGNLDISRLNAVIFLLFKPQGRGKSRLDLIPSDQQIKYFIEKFRNSKVRFKIGMDACLVNKIMSLDKPTEIEKIFLDTCEAGRGSMYITPDMKAVPCSFADCEKYGVSITSDNPIQIIWNKSESFNCTRKNLIENNSRCPYEGII